MRRLTVSSICLLLLLAGPAFALTVGFAPDSSFSVTTGTTYSRELVVGELGGQIVAAYDFDLVYDPGLILPTTFTFSQELGDESLFEVFNYFNFDTGVADIAAVSLLSDADLAAVQNGVLVKLGTFEFTALGDGEAAFAFDWGPGQDIKGFGNGVIYPAAPVPEPGTLLLVGAGLGGLLARSRKRIRP